ncbi:V-type ATP synthase subunit D [Carboxylicivirga mesophila]|uniref:V-type ATP synthase subunit D n=2 Tax=Carboxylicivirga TaxID=1628153 RepID=A0A941F6K8_9BACT|nr:MULTISPECIES: V-type ATP synthase subunit D [Carboxylicivirga]MBR8537414.1 V-type ATP synthase subunit D [Carboxylicivirga sediminis]MBS2210184.1 V-type ATP synthase subunit D [Carboxylicivirga mesophila]
MAGVKIKYTKTERARQKKILKVSLRMLPLFEAMEKSLMSTINTIAERIEEIRQVIERNNRHADPWVAVMSDSHVDITSFISVNKVLTKHIDVAGVRVDQYEGVDFNVAPIHADTPLWVDDAIELMKEQLQLMAEIDCLQKQIHLLEEELLDVRARIKLFENRRIPNAKTAIRKIGQKLQDDERLTIATAKVVKTSQKEGVMV